MGVPGYFKWMIQHCPGIQIKDIPVDCLYIDANAILHPACQYEGHSLSVTSEDAMISNFCEKLDEIIFASQPRKLIYIAFDGPPPMAKMVQQRSRRFCTRSNLAVQCKLYKKLAAEWKKEGWKAPQMPYVWDSNNITPGTPFMTKVRSATESYISDRISDSAWRNYRDVIWLLSDTNEPGEGEHKIIQFIKKQRNEAGYNSSTTHCLVGMDADLIQLALSIHDPNMLIFRDEIFISIKMVREYFRACFSSILNNPNLAIEQKNFERLLDDLLMMFFLVGNDFLPPLPQMKIAGNTIGRCLSVYISEYPKLGDYLTDGSKLNLPACEKFMNSLSRILHRVNDPIKEVINWYDKIERAYYTEIKEEEYPGGSLERVFWSTLRRRVEIYLWTCTAKTYLQDVVCVSLPAWQDRYYALHWRKHGDSNEIRKKVNYEYMRGLQWVLTYYHEDCPDWEWYYPYHRGPTLDNLHPDQIPSSALEFTKDTLPVFPFQQLLIVSPREGAELLLPRYLVNFMYSDLSQYYPEKYAIDFSSCPPKWMAQAILPVFNLDHLHSITLPSIFQLSGPERKANQRKGVRLFVNKAHRINKEFDDSASTHDGYLDLNWLRDELSGVVYMRKSGMICKKLSGCAVRFQYQCPSANIKQTYCESATEIGLVSNRNSISPLSTDSRLYWEGLNGLSYPMWGVSIDESGKVCAPEKKKIKAKTLEEKKRRFKFGDYDESI
ncbi:hypothetical protein XU18_1779 [Perkinsela sp. CCAP 1560/4]|nr:hypothetical protein XU18_1779 [Perkinsela sp. CCAP 1560/4]|eukprot:KNH07558.1 hypothetical protein XU18_1779 [Perkinsela sp. CCAP 1560/4]